MAKETDDHSKDLSALISRGEAPRFRVWKKNVTRQSRSSSRTGKRRELPSHRSGDVFAYSTRPNVAKKVSRARRRKVALRSFFFFFCSDCASLDLDSKGLATTRRLFHAYAKQNLVALRRNAQSKAIDCDSTYPSLAVVNRVYNRTFPLYHDKSSEKVSRRVNGEKKEKN